MKGLNVNLVAKISLTLNVNLMFKKCQFHNFHFFPFIFYLLKLFLLVASIHHYVSELELRPLPVTFPLLSPTPIVLTCSIFLFLCCLHGEVWSKETTCFLCPVNQDGYIRVRERYETVLSKVYIYLVCVSIVYYHIIIKTFTKSLVFDDCLKSCPRLHSQGSCTFVEAHASLPAGAARSPMKIISGRRYIIQRKTCGRSCCAWKGRSPRNMSV